MWLVLELCICVHVAKHLQKSVPVKATSIRGSGSIVGTAVQHKQPAQPNHVVAATPVAVTSPQRPPSGAVSSLQSVVVNRPPVVSSVSHPSHEQLLRHELQKLQKEKERLRREQEEAVRRVSLSTVCHSRFLLHTHYAIILSTAWFTVIRQLWCFVLPISWFC